MKKVITLLLLLFTTPALAQSMVPDQRGNMGGLARTNRLNYFTKGIEEQVYANGNSGTSFALNIDNGGFQSVTISGAVTITLSIPTHTGKTMLVVKQDGSGHVYSVSGCKWAGGTAITYSTAAGKIDLISVAYDGSNFYCMGGAAFN